MGLKIKKVPFTVTDWNAVRGKRQSGESGTSLARTRMAGRLRLRLVDYSPNYRADHWCSRGHIFLVLKGELRVELEGEDTQVLRKGDSYHVSDGVGRHRSSTRRGARLFIVD